MRAIKFIVLLVMLASIMSCENQSADGTVVFHLVGGHVPAGCFVGTGPSLYEMQVVGTAYMGLDLEVDCPPGHCYLLATRKGELGGVCGQTDIELDSGETFVWDVDTSL
jgi:hypothetical protein